MYTPLTSFRRHFVNAARTRSRSITALAFFVTILFIVPFSGISFKKKIENPLEELDPEFHKQYEKYIIPRSYLPSENSLVFILGVVAKNSSASASWDIFSVYGQWYYHKRVKEKFLRCCFKFKNGTITEKHVANYYAHFYDRVMYTAELVMWHITCINTEDGGRVIPAFVSIARYHSCSSEFVSYKRHVYALRQAPDHLVITTKLAYGKFNPESVVNFVETVRYLGVDKVVTYVHESLAGNVRKVLLYYASLGIVEYHQLQLADYLKRPRYFALLDGQYMNDEWLVKRDAIERNSGSEYFGIFDMDEYLIPSDNRTLKEMLTYLRAKYSSASHFFFKNVHYLTDMGSCPGPCSMFRNYVMVHPARFNGRHEKMIAIVSRVKAYTINNHFIESEVPYTRATCPESVAYVRHYGVCWRKFFSHCHPKTWIKDTSMAEWIEQTMQSKIQRAQKIIHEL